MGKFMSEKGQKQKGKKRDRTKWTCSMGHKRTYKFSQDWTYKKHLRMHHPSVNPEEATRKRVMSFDFKESKNGSKS